MIQGIVVPVACCHGSPSPFPDGSSALLSSPSPRINLETLQKQESQNICLLSLLHSPHHPSHATSQHYLTHGNGVVGGNGVLVW